jgi:hypothetical protein
MVKNNSIPAPHANPKSLAADFGQKKALPFFKPFIQPKLSINTPDDIYEREADAVADRLMRMTDSDISHSKFFKPAIPVVQSKCAHCEEEEEKVNRKEINEDETPGYPGFDKYVENLDNNGQSLSGDVRNFYEPRLGYDFTNVKVHTDSIAAKSAQSINALAFTSGNHIVFNSGQYAPGTETGKKLLGHELAHVVQQGSGVHSKQIQRMSIGSGTPPPSWVTSYNARVVPAAEVAQLQAAIDMIANIVNNPGDYADCLQAFADRCTGNSPTAFADAFNNAVIWRGDDAGARARGTVNGSNIFYTQSGYDQGARGLAHTLIHEMGHNCGIAGGDDHYLAEVNATYCIGPLTQVGLRVGIGLTSPAFGLAVTYRRFFDLALGGQLQFSLGADFDLAGLAMGIMDATDDRVGHVLPSFEFGSVSAGLRGRFNPWGGEGFGGITLGTEAGFDAGRFRIVREAGAEEFEYGPGFILQSTAGAEFYIPRNPFIERVSVDAGYRLIRPLNSEAENIHEIVFGFSGMF